MTFEDIKQDGRLWAVHYADEELNNWTEFSPNGMMRHGY